MPNVIKSTVTINGEDVDSIDAAKLDNLFQEAGYLENGFEEVEFLALNSDGHATFKCLTFDENEGEYIVGLAFVTPEGADFPGVPIATFPEEEYYKALEGYNHVSWTPGRIQEAASSSPEEVSTWTLERLPGDGRGGVFWNAEIPFVDEKTGVRVLDHDGYDDEDDEDGEGWDDFGHQWYYATVEGTKSQVEAFLKEHFYGEGTMTMDGPVSLQESASHKAAGRLREANAGTRYVAKWEEYGRAGSKTKTIRFTAASGGDALRKVFDKKVLTDVSSLADFLEDRGIEEGDINPEFLKKYFSDLDPSGEDFLVSLEDVYGHKVFDMGLDDGDEEDWDEDDSDDTPSDAVGDIVGQAVAALVDEYGWDEDEAFNAVHDVSTPEGLAKQIKEAIENVPYDDDTHCDEVSHIARGLVDLALAKE